MNRKTTNLSVLALVGAGLWIGYGPRAVSFAQQPSKVGPPAESPEKSGPRIKAKVTKINKLREMTEQKLDLTVAQKGAIGRLFDGFIDDLKANLSNPKEAAKRDNKVYPPNMKQLEEQLKAAQKVGDKAKVDEIERQISVMKKEPTWASDDHSSVLIEKIKTELKPNQVAEFEKVVVRWQAISPRGPRTGPFQQLRRALADPEVGLSEAQKTATEQILNATLKEVRTDSSRNPEKMAQAVDKAKTAIFEKLTPEQQNKVNEDLKMFKAEEKDFDDSKYRGPNAVKRNGQTEGEKKPADDK